MNLYLTGTVHHLTKADADNRAGPLDHVKEEDDGTYSVFNLSTTPRQHGQAAYVGHLE